MDSDGDAEYRIVAEMMDQRVVDISESSGIAQSAVSVSTLDIERSASRHFGADIAHEQMIAERLDNRFDLDTVE
jgi:hypothetical protein